MLKIFITGSSDGIGLEAAKELLKAGHEVLFHARNHTRAKELERKLTKPCKILVADLSDIEQTKQLAQDLNALGVFDVIIHNAGVYQSSKQEIFRVNVLAPYLLTALIQKPKKLLYIGSNMHPQGDFSKESLSLESGVDYATSKLQVLMLSLAVARVYTDTFVSTIDPGWVRTKMANYNAPVSIEDGAKTQVCLATDTDLYYRGKYFLNLKESSYAAKADDIQMQAILLQKCQEITGVSL